MGTLADLKRRIIAQTARDDLTDDLAPDLNAVIASAVDLFAAERWWFNESRATSVCTAGNAFQPIPAEARFIDKLFLLIGANRYELTKRDVGTIERLQGAGAAGQPTDYAVLGSQVYLWPVPSQAFSLLWELVADVSPALDFANDSSSNAWTLAGADLIVAQAKLLLLRDYLSASGQDPRITLAVAQETEAYQRLKGESNRRLSTGRVKPSW